MPRYEPSKKQKGDFYANYPAEYADCRTFGHGPETDYSVKQIGGSRGRIEVTRECKCGRLVTRVYTARFERLPKETRVIYPSHPRYLALPGMGGVDREKIARKAIEPRLRGTDAA